MIIKFNSHHGYYIQKKDKTIKNTGLDIPKLQDI